LSDQNVDAVKRVLVVDDSALIRRMSRRMLENLNFEVYEAVNGSEAVEACERQAMDVILLDWNMPVMDGLTFLRQLRASSLLKQPKVIFCTTEHTPEKIELAIEAGADEFIMKPYDEEILHLKLRQVGVIPEGL
jgi:two-component system, chemotaxis family, chemotaxis protein CheY